MSQLKANPATASIPVIFVTALNDEKSEVRGLSVGGVDFISKPINRSILLARVKTHLALQNSYQTLADHHEQIHSILNTVADGIVGIDPQGRVTFANAAALQMLAYDKSELLGANLHTLVHRSPEGEWPAESCELLQALATRESDIRSGEAIYARQSGTRFPVEYTFSIVSKNQVWKQAVVAFRDITERKQAELQLKEAASVFENSSDSIFICDPQNRILRVNRAFTAITGYSPKDVMGKNPNILKSGRHDIHFYAALWCELLENGHWIGEMWNRRKDGSLYPEWLTITVVRDEQMVIAGFIAQFSDISSHKQVEDEYRYRGNYDSLTDLPNRYLLVERLKMALREAHRYQRLVALLFVDLDYFKVVNDSLGHLAGDQVLQEVAKRLTLCIRETDTAARQGGDEFIVVLQDIEGHDTTAQIADKIIRTLSEPFRISNHLTYVGASIGIAISPEHGQEVIDLMDKADIALYRAKEKGRNNFQFYHAD